MRKDQQVTLNVLEHSESVGWSPEIVSEVTRNWCDIRISPQRVNGELIENDIITCVQQH